MVGQENLSQIKICIDETLNVQPNDSVRKMARRTYSTANDHRTPQSKFVQTTATSVKSCMAGLFPTAAEVLNFPPEEDGYEYEYEARASDRLTSYVTFDLGNIDQNLLLNASSCKLIGLDTPTPYLQLPGITMRGSHDTLIGSELIFADGRDPNNRSRRLVTHLGTTSNRITFEPVQLKPHNPEAFPREEDDSVPPSVLFQGPRKKKSAAKDRATSGDGSAEPPRRGRGRGRGRPRGRGRGRGRGSIEDSKRGRGDSKGKGKAKARGEDSDSRGEVNYDDLDEDSDDAMDEPGPSVRRTSSRRSKKGPGTQSLDLGVLETLESMDIEGAADD